MTRTASIVAIGSEMLGPHRVDTNSLKIAGVLEDYGIAVRRKGVVGDVRADVVAEILFSVRGSDIVVITGGLGPTEDDMTREALSEAFGLTLDLDETIVEKIAARFAARGIPMAEVNKRQAYVFHGQTTLNNERGTAPGFHLHVQEKDIWVFPGVPNELEWMLATYFRPWLESECGSRARYRRVLKIAGMSESGVEEKLKPFYAAHAGEPLTILASGGQIELHLCADGSEVEAGKFIAEREAELLSIFGNRIFGFDDDSLESVIGQMLTDKGETLATAESCTGGLLSSRITDVPGSSRYFAGGAICYDARAKVALAGVDATLIRENGEVSEQVAIAMAAGIRERFGTAYGVSITGIAGPGGGSEEKPVGTVHIAVASESGATHRKMFWPSTRPLVRWFSAQAALDLLRKVMVARENAQHRDTEDTE